MIDLPPGAWVAYHRGRSLHEDIEPDTPQGRAAHRRRIAWLREQHARGLVELARQRRADGRWDFLAYRRLAPAPAGRLPA